MTYFLGIDGGGTRTTAWLADERGRVLSRAEAGPSNPIKVGLEAAQREILRAAHQAVAAVYNHRPPLNPLLSEKRSKKIPLLAKEGKQGWLEAVVAGIAGVDRPQVHRPLSRWLRKAVPARFHLLTTDAAIALHAALGDAPGIIVISGTGSIAYGQDARGRLFRAGGWGSQFDDAGSGFDLGRKAIAAALRACDGRGAHTQLAARICRALRLRDIPQIVARELTSQQIAALFPLVIQAAGRRDRVARLLLDDAGRSLAELALALVRRLGWAKREIPVICAGGVFQASGRIRRTFARHLRLAVPQARVRPLRRPPVEGALALAHELITQRRAPRRRRSPAVQPMGRFI
jgi:N-acetylglucosamine kinase-like BadF-type ATPase